MSDTHRTPAEGFTLLEVLIATALLVTVSIGIAHLFAIVASAGREARARTSSTILAAGKLEQLRSLAWGYEPLPDDPPVPRSDMSTNLGVDPPGDGGPGLAPSPTGTLAANIPPYVDYLDARGRWVGNGATPPANTVFIRRWAVQPLAGPTERTLVLHVLVTTTRLENARQGPWQKRTGEECLLAGIVTRKGR